jgi:PKD repeat protein
LATWDRYKSNTTGVEIISQKGGRFTPRFYCDDTSGSVYVTKAPVAVLKLTPTSQFTNTNIAWDVSQSVSTTGTIDTYDLTFGGGGASDLTGQSWAGAKTGNVQYTSTGTYTVTLTVTDTAGNVSAPAQQTVTISEDTSEDLETSGTEKIYIATSDTGIFTYTTDTAPAAVNTGLSGGDLNVNSGRLHPAYAWLPETKHHYWFACDTGVIYSTDGAATWNKITKATLGAPTNEISDSPHPGTDDLDEIAIEYDPQDKRRVYVLRLTNSTWNGSNSPRAYLFFTEDYGPSWVSKLIGVNEIYDLVKSSNGNAHSAVATSADGQEVFIALEDDAGGNQYVFKLNRLTDLNGIITGDLSQRETLGDDGKAFFSPNDGQQGQSYVWSFVDDEEGWGFRDESTGSGVPDDTYSRLTYDEDGESLEQNAVVIGATNQLSRGWLISPPLSVSVVTGNTIEMDVSALIPGTLATTRRIKAFYSDGTTQEQTSVGTGATTVILTINKTETLERIELVAVEVGTGGGSTPFNITCDVTEVRLIL